MSFFSKYFIPALLWLAIITGMSVVPKITFPKFDLFATDKVGHFAAYAVLVGLVLYGMRKQTGRQATWKEGFVVFCAATLYGAMLEFVQGNFIPGRFFGYDDMIANALGAAAAWGLSNFLTPRATVA